MVQRAWSALLNIVNLAHGTAGPVLVVAHARVNRVLLVKISGLPLQEGSFPFPSSRAVSLCAASRGVLSDSCQPSSTRARRPGYA
ncbi:MAG: hypothetical protein HQQ73_06830 [Desulfobulbaceae bacterium]|nr:hypothetical protein [Desulfobulbaceae bacterium]